MGLLTTEFGVGQVGASFGLENGAAVRIMLAAAARDDCAAYEMRGEMILVVGSDYVRGSRFKLYELGLMSNFEVGYYLVVANLSDVAAMGALPVGVLTVVRYPRDLDDSEFRSIMAGITQAAEDHGTFNVGGDIGDAERVILSGTGIGVCEPGSLLRRSGAEVGDILCVTGPCGIPGAAVAYFGSGAHGSGAISAAFEEKLLSSWRRPRARIKEGRVLAGPVGASSCQDTSDGLKATIEAIAEASAVGFEVLEQAIPIDDAVRAVAEVRGVDPATLAMSASPDFQLLFTISPERLPECRRLLGDVGTSLIVLGRTVVETDGIYMAAADGRRSALPGIGWRHQNTKIEDLVSDNATERDASEAG